MKIVFVSGYDKSSLEKRDLQLADGFLQKPVRLRELIDTIRAVIPMLNCNCEEDICPYISKIRKESER